MKRLEFDKQGFLIDGKRDFLVGGEIAYFRVNKERWAESMDQFKEMGGNLLTTSVPWIVHEPKEGELLFDDCAYRDLTDYLTLAKEKNLFVYLRLGPLVYTELVNGGIPQWLFDDYPQTQAKNADGSYIRQLSYLHPTTIEKFQAFYEKACEIIRPFLLKNGGTVAVVQLDNELAGVHTWSGTLDFNEETMGFFREDGLYPAFLKRRFQTVERLNKSYGTAYASFAEIDPRLFWTKPTTKGAALARAQKDYHDFYCEHLSVYAKTLHTLVRSHGIDGAVAINAANAYLLNYLKETVESFEGEKLIFGFDNYYSLDVNWANFHPTPKWFMKNVYAVDAMKAMGYPFTVLEMQGGSYADVPPVLAEDMEQWCMLNLALGMKGVSYYIFTGGANPPGTGMTTDVYDFQAPVSSTGEKRSSFYALKKFHNFAKRKKWLLTAERVNSVQLGFEWQTMRGNDYAAHAGVQNTLQAEDRLIKCLSFSLVSSGYSYGFTELTKPLDISKPLLLLSPDTMSERAQANVVEFIKRGGGAYILSTLPTLNERFEPCTVLKDFIGEATEEANDGHSFVTLLDGERVYYVNCPKKLTKLPNGATVYATDGEKENVLGFRIKRGKGKVVYLGGQWLTTDTVQVRALEKVIAELGGKPCVRHSNPSVYANLLAGEKKLGLFVYNTYTGKQSSVVEFSYQGKDYALGEVKLKAGEVKYFEFDLE